MQTYCMALGKSLPASQVQTTKMAFNFTTLGDYMLSLSLVYKQTEALGCYTISLTSYSRSWSQESTGHIYNKDSTDTESAQAGYLR